MYTRPRLDLDPYSALSQVDPHGMLGDLNDRRVLCLCSGGGKQSAAFALLGADVTVVDLSPDQLGRDRYAAEHYGVKIKTIEGDMRDLSILSADSFDLVEHAYSINFVPDCLEVFGQVKRVLRDSGLYRLMIANPFGMPVGYKDWNGEGYLVREPYIDGAKVTYDDQEWVYHRRPGSEVPRPVEYRHNLSTVINGLADRGFRILHFSDSQDMHPDASGGPGTWDHYVAFMPPWFTFLTRLEY